MSDLSNAANPAITSRLLDQLTDMTLLLDQVPAVTFAADEPWVVLQRALESMEKLAVEAGLHRPATTPG